MSAGERLAEVERVVAKEGSAEQKHTLLVSKRLLNKDAFSSISAIHKLFEDLNVEVGKSVSDRSRHVVLLYLALKDKKFDHIKEVERKMEEYTSQTSSLSDWSKLINRKEGDVD